MQQNHQLHVVDVSSVRSVLSRIRRVTTGTLIMPEDHNDQTEAITRLTDVLEATENPKTDTLSFIRLKIHTTPPTPRSGMIYLLHNTERNRVEARFVTDTLETRRIYPADFVDAYRVILAPINYDPPLKAGRLWFRGDIPEIRFSPNGTLVSRVWPATHYPTRYTSEWWSGVISRDFDLPVTGGFTLSETFTFPVTAQPGWIITGIVDWGSGWGALNVWDKYWYGRITFTTNYTYNFGQLGLLLDMTGPPATPRIGGSVTWAPVFNFQIYIDKAINSITFYDSYQHISHVGDPPFRAGRDLQLRLLRPV